MADWTFTTVSPPFQGIFTKEEIAEYGSFWLDRALRVIWEETKAYKMAKEWVKENADDFYSKKEPPKAHGIFTEEQMKFFGNRLLDEALRVFWGFHGEEAARCMYDGQWLEVGILTKYRPRTECYT